MKGEDRMVLLVSYRQIITLLIIYKDKDFIRGRFVLFFSYSFSECYFRVNIILHL